MSPVRTLGARNGTRTHAYAERVVTEVHTPASSAAHSPFPDDLSALVERYLEELRFDGESEAERLREAVRYSLLGAGKRVRPVLTLATARAVGIEPESVLPTAAAIELLHTNSLIADDLPAMDDHKLRRGKPPLHVAFGEDIALLAGGALGAEAYRLILECQEGPPERVLAVGKEIARTIGIAGMVGGQYLDVAGSLDRDGSLLRRMHELKTGVLIAAAVNCALLLAGLDGTAATAYRTFGGEVGLLFQIVDDILDVNGSEKKLGKRRGSDRRLGKQTYVSLYGLDRALELAAESYGAATRALAQAACHAPHGVDELAAIAASIYARAGR